MEKQKLIDDILAYMIASISELEAKQKELHAIQLETEKAAYALCGVNSDTTDKRLREIQGLQAKILDCEIENNRLNIEFLSKKMQKMTVEQLQAMFEKLKTA